MQFVPALFSLFGQQIVEAPIVPRHLWSALLPLHAIWDPGATSDMGSIFAIALIDYWLCQKSKGALRGIWRKPAWPRTFRVANGQQIQAIYEVEFKIPLVNVEGNHYLTFNVAAVDTGSKGPEQVPWLFSNESGNKIGAVVSSRTGKVTFEDERLPNWKVNMEKGSSGHWLFPIVTAFIELATPAGCSQPVSDFASQDPQNVQILNNGVPEQTDAHGDAVLPDLQVSP